LGLKQSIKTSNPGYKGGLFLGYSMCPVGFEPVTWRITAQFLYGYSFVLCSYTNS